jgi:hypothetical protein
MITYSSAPVQIILDLIYHPLGFLSSLAAWAAACVCSRGYVNESGGWICRRLASPVGYGVATAAVDPATSWDEPGCPPLAPGSCKPPGDCCTPLLTPGAGVGGAVAPYISAAAGVPHGGRNPYRSGPRRLAAAGPAPHSGPLAAPLPPWAMAVTLPTTVAHGGRRGARRLVARSARSFQTVI